MAVHSMCWPMDPEILFARSYSRKDLPEDQCIFVRGFRATRKLRILPTKLKGAAGPKPDSKGYDEGSDAELIPVPALPEVKSPHSFWRFLVVILVFKVPRPSSLITRIHRRSECCGHKFSAPLVLI